MHERVADTLVIGAGIIGASVAWRLAQRGLTIVLVDAGKFGGEASSAGAGMLAPGGEVTQRSPLSDLLTESLRCYPAFVRELSHESGLGIDFVRCGAWEYAGDEQEFSALRQRAADQAKLGISSVVDEFNMRLIYPDDALVDPGDVMRALRLACAKWGVAVVEGTRVDRVDVNTEGVRAGSISARTAVIAAGAWSSQIALESFPLPRAFPVKGHLIGYQLPAGTVGPIRRQGHTYILQRSNGFTIAGSSSEEAGFDKNVVVAISNQIRARAEQLYPLLKQHEPVHVWTGLRPATHAADPIITRCGEMPVWLAYGHYRNGILGAPVTAARIASEITASLEKG